MEIAGVVENYHQRSLHHSMLPMIYDFSSNMLMTDGYYSVKVEKKADRSALIMSIRKAYQKAFPNTVFDPFDFKTYYIAQYQSDHHFKRLHMAFTVLGLIIACMGLFGLAMITISKRSKEISIRKVLGASTTTILFILTKDFMKLIVIAIIIAAPMAYYLMSAWLQNFNFRINIPWWIFIAAGFVAVVLAFTTIGYQSLRAALVNPVESLR
jgi:putative ABC transport system permease protein